MIIRREPVRAPFPGVARYGVKTEAIRGEGIYRCCAGIAILGSVLGGEIALPDVAHVRATGGQFVSPREPLLFQASAGGEFPFGFGRQTLPGPFRKRAGIVPGHMCHRVFFSPGDVGVRAFRMQPVRSVYLPPPMHACRGS
ncbi:MAG: hypothetical protein QOJ99_875, partial [Bryobacterales bacterium]|nr:hypothetical protein [Bryobacterales bacterium]